MVVFTSMSTSSSVLRAVVNEALDFRDGIAMCRCSVASFSKLLKPKPDVT